VAFNVPSPPDYGGVIDVYYKLRALHALGVHIILHCFTYGREETADLNAFCAEVYYYPRKPMWKGFFKKLPFITASRYSEQLLKRLRADQHPILYEGLHCCATLEAIQGSGKIQMVRIHNDEGAYYHFLSINEGNLLKKLYFKSESRRLKRFENTLHLANALLTISKKEYAEYSARFSTVVYTGPFHENTLVRSSTGRGAFILYHGNLSVNENLDAAFFLIRNVFCHVQYPIVIAGQNPSIDLQQEINKWEHIQLVSNPNKAQLDDLIKEAHIHTLLTFQSTGMKLKLINSLFCGRFCLVNSEMISQTGLDSFTIQADSPTAMIESINHYMQQDFTEKDVEKRRELEILVNNEMAANIILQSIRQSALPTTDH
jgi:hypothetical protein